MTVNAITDTKKGRTGIAPTYLHTTQQLSLLTYRVRYLSCYACQYCYHYSRRAVTPSLIELLHVLSEHVRRIGMGPY